MINVTNPFLPPIEEYNFYLKDIWQRNWHTNNGPLVNQLESELKDYLGVDYLLYVNNGTIALQIAIKALELKGEVITTPFSYVATSSSIVWQGCTPVFADIDPDTLNIDPAKIEAAITGRTTGIVATHVYGNACDIDAIQLIADKYNLKVIYDAAHCFGCKYKGRSIFEYGDISITSFHATKLYHSIEGGALFTKDTQLWKKMSLMRNFGHDGPDHFGGLGINGKNSEYHAAMGLVNLKHVNDILTRRRELSDIYRQLLTGLRIRQLKVTANCDFNYAYYPIIFENEASLLKAVELLNANQVFPRRYFYPSLTTLSYVNKCDTPVCDSTASQVLCLPLYHSLTEEEIGFVCQLLISSQK